MLEPASTSRRRLCWLTLWLASCATPAWAQGPATSTSQRFPDVIAVRVRASAPDIFNFDVTVSSPYDTPQRYADGFRVTTLAGASLGERQLLHDHQGEQPFTRDLNAVRIPSTVKTVLVQARDQVHGYGGAALQIALPDR
jgi:hypothetical protein